MSRKEMNNTEDALSLVGSQISTPLSSSRRPNSAERRANYNASGARQKTNTASSGRIPTSPSSNRRVHSGRSDTSARTTGRSVNRGTSGPNTTKAGSEDFLSLFDNSVTPKIKKPQQKVKAATKPAWASYSGRNAATAGSDAHSNASKTSKHSHSIFQPTSARSNSTVDDEQHQGEIDEFNELMSKITQSEQELELSSVASGFTSHRVNGADVPRTAAASDRRGSSRELPATSSKLSPRVAALDQVMNTINGRSRNLSHGENDLNVTSDETASGKATKLNSIANNMTSQARGSSVKNPLENSVQNIKHKTPVNQVKTQSHNVNSYAVGSNSLARQSSRTSNPDSALDRERRDRNLAKRREMSAIRIQRFYRRHRMRKKSGEAALKRMLESKRREWEGQEVRDSLSVEANRDAERKKIREEKARQARLQAIQELQKKREEKREENKRKSEEEMQFLQASGKVTRKPARKSNNNKNTAAAVQGGARSRLLDSDSDEASSPPGAMTGARPKTKTSHQHPNASTNQTAEAAGGATNGHESDVHEETARTLLASAREAATHRSEEDGSQSAARTTLDDLMATLSKLEEGASFDKRHTDRSKNEKPLAWLDELEKTAAPVDGARRNDMYLSMDNLERLDKDNVKKSGVLGDEKLRNIITYLDEVDTAERLSQIDQELARANEALENPALLVPSSDELAQLEQASANAAEVTSTVLHQKMELEEKKRNVMILQKALKQQRELTVRHARETERDMKKRLDVQKNEYEDTIKRHLSFIDQLIDDKKSLSEKCENLVKELKTVDKKYSDKLKTMADTHDQELRKVKEIHAAAEKLRREKWIDDKTKKIKEMTVKGLEPEIQRLIAKHNAEIKKLKSIHEAELLASDERAGGKYIRMTEELRDQLAHEKEQACARERELARQTYEKQMQQEEEAYQQQRRRLYAEVQEEKERLAQQGSRQRIELDRLQRQLEDQTTNASESMRREYEKARDEQERRHEAETRQLREKLTVEKTAWEENYMKKQDAWCLQKERELKEQVRRERDKEIELVIRRLEEDSQGSREECERVADNRIKRIRDKYEAEISELERSERLTTEKYNQTKAKLAELEGECERMKVTLRQKDKEIEELKKLLEKLNEERSHVSDVIRQEFADRIVATDEENRRIKNEMSELKARHKIELERGRGEIEIIQKAKDEEMEEVHKRVKQAILKKEEVMTQLREQYQSAVKRADHLEGLLEQQRKQLLGNKKL